MKLITHNKSISPALDAARSGIAAALRHELQEVEDALPAAGQAIDRARAEMHDAVAASLRIHSQSAGDMAPGAHVIDERKAASAASLTAQRAVAAAVNQRNVLRMRQREISIRLRRLAAGESFELPSDRAVPLSGPALLAMSPQEVQIRTSETEHEREAAATAARIASELERQRKQTWDKKPPVARRAKTGETDAVA